MRASAFFDSNILIYAVSHDERSERAESLLAIGGVVSVHVLNEFVSVVRRKMKMPWTQVIEAVDAITILCPNPVPLGMEIHAAALKIAQRYKYDVYDSLVIAAGLQANCKILYSEDLHHGQVIGGLQIDNPFKR